MHVENGYNLSEQIHSKWFIPCYILIKCLEFEDKNKLPCIAQLKQTNNQITSLGKNI